MKIMIGRAFRASVLSTLPFILTAATEPPSPLPTTQDSSNILVTAQRREQRAQDVPAAVTALSSKQIEDAQMRSLDRLGAMVPNLYLARNFGTTSGALIFMRGVGEGDSIFTNDLPVGIYVDDVIFPRSTGSLFDFIDVERVEVLRGPQGTLYGRNTSGGAIKLVTKRPAFDRAGGVADLSLGSYGRVDGRATFNLPVLSNLAVRVSALSRNQRGWGHNLTDGKRVNGQDVQGARTAVLWQLGNRLTIYGTTDFSRERSTPRFPQRFLPDTSSPGRFTNEFASPGGDIDNFHSPDTNSLNKTDSGGAMLRAELKLGQTKLTSITGYRKLRSRIGFDQTANAPGTGPNVILLQDQKQHSFSEELQLSGSALGGRLTWLNGLYYFAEHNDQLTAISFASPTGSADERYQTDDFFIAPSRSSGLSGNWSPYRPELDTKSVSAFASGTLQIGRRASVTAGARYTRERKTYFVQFLSAPDTVVVLPDGTLAQRRIAKHWHDLSPRFSVDYRLEGPRWHALAYALVAKGFRSGSFDGRARNIDFVMNRQGAIAPETVWSSEAGVKSDWFNRRLLLTVDYFINNYTDIAFSAARANTVPPEIFRQNVGDARIQGLEAEWTLKPVPGVELGGWIGTLADRFTKLKASPGCTAFVPDETELDLRFTPALRYQVRASFERRLKRGRIRLGGDYSGSSPYFISLCNEPQHRVTNASIANAQLSYDLDDWSFTLSATNLFDRRFNTGSVGSIGYPMEPRQVLVTAQRRF